MNQWKQLSEHVEFLGTHATLRIEGRTVFLQHFPTKGDGDSFEKDRHDVWRLPLTPRHFLIHGHTHRADQQAHGRSLHVGLDAWDLKPVHERVVKEWVLTAEPEAE